MIPKFGQNKDGYDLHNIYTFQGFHIHVENAAGSYRFWTDHRTGEQGKTRMLYDYGYFTGSYASSDGDEVDVYVGSDEVAEYVYIIDQMQVQGGFKHFDEQKVMLGFSSPMAAKVAYLSHYNDPRFFGCINAYAIEQFRDKLKNNKGEIIKSRLKTGDFSDRIRGNMSKPIVEYVYAGTPIQNETGMSPARIHALQKSGLVSTGSQHFVAPTVEGPEGTNRVGSIDEPPVVPVRRVDSNDRYGA